MSQLSFSGLLTIVGVPLVLLIVGGLVAFLCVRGSSNKR
jgi:hypothetical protein